jgi:hypothetical protein
VNPNEEMAGPIRRGRLMEFLRQDLFTVELDDGIAITAVMPEEFFPIYDPNVPLTRFNWLSVEVEMREPPAIPKIVSARKISFCGLG